MIVLTVTISARTSGFTDLWVCATLKRSVHEAGGDELRCAPTPSVQTSRARPTYQHRGAKLYYPLVQCHLSVTYQTD